MMMKCLHDGGIPAIFSPEQDKLNPEDHSLYEIGRRYYLDAKFCRDILCSNANDGSCVKIFFDGLPTLPVHKYSILFMLRRPEDIANSLSKLELPENWTEHKPFDVYRDYCEEDILQVINICQQRKDMTVYLVDFPSFRKNPTTYLRHLQLPPGFDREKAIQAVRQ